MKNIKMLKHSLALLLILFVGISISNINVHAEENSVENHDKFDVNNDNKVTYMSIGDSMTNGYGMDGYYPAYDGKPEGEVIVHSKEANSWTSFTDHTVTGNVFGYDRHVEETYSAALRDYLMEKSDLEVEWLPSAISGLRSEDLLWLLDPYQEYQGDLYTDYIWKNGTPQDGKVSRFIKAQYGNSSAKVDEIDDSFELVDPQNNLYDSELARSELELFKQEYTNRIKNSDIISIHFGTHTFASIAANRVRAVLGIGNDDFYDERVTLDYMLDTYPAFKGLYQKYEPQIKAYLAEMVGLDANNEYFGPLYDVFAYCTLSIIYSYDRVLEIIRDINPEAQIIIMGVNNFLDGLKLVNNGETVVDFGELLNYFIDLVNLHRASFADGAFRAIYVDTLKNVDTLLNSFGRNEMNETYLAYTFQYIREMNSTVSNLTEYENNPADLRYGLVGQNPADGSYVKLATGIEMHRFILRYLNAKTDEERANAIAKINWTNDAFAPGGPYEAMSQYALGMVIDAIVPVFEDFRGYANLNEFEFSILPDILENGINDLTKLSEKSVEFVMNLNLRCFVAEGIGCHTSELGHAQLADALIDCLENNYTGKDYFLEQLRSIHNLLLKYGPSALHFIYNKLEEEGIIAELEIEINYIIEDLTNFRDYVEYNVLSSLMNLKQYYENRLHLFEENPVEAAKLTIEDIKTTIALIDEAIEEVKNTIDKYDDEIAELKELFDQFVEFVLNSTPKDVQDKVYLFLEYIENLSSGLINAYDLSIEIENDIRKVEVLLKDLYEQALVLKTELEVYLCDLYVELETKLNVLAEEIAAEADICVEVIKEKLSESKENAIAYFAELGIDIESKANYLLYELSLSKEELTNELLSFISDLEAAINGSKDALLSRLEQYNKELSAKLENLKDEALAYAEELKLKVKEIYNNATTDEYVTTEDSYYVAFGDSTAANDSYVELFAEKLFLDETMYNNLALKGMRVEDLLYLLDHEVVGDQYSTVNFAGDRDYYLEEVLKADIITLGFNNLDFTLAQLGSLVPYEIDWSLYFGDEIAELVEKLLVKIEEQLKPELGLFTNQAMTIAESYIYNYIGSTISYGKLLNTIHKLNPEALIITVGTYNPFAELVINNNDEEISVGQYIEYVFASFDVLHLASSIVEELSITISLDSVTTEFDSLLTDNEEPIYVKMLQLLLTNPDVFLPSEDGKELIASKLYSALTHECEHVATSDDHDCTTPIVCKLCGEILVPGASEHTPVVIPAVDATCSKAGSTEGSKCSVCGTILVEPVEVAQLDHTYDNTCDVDCNVCGASRTPGQHVYDNRCDELCNICGGKRRTLGHVFGDWSVVEESTKHDHGKEARVCNECGYVEYRELPLEEGMGTGAVVAIVGSSTAVAAAGGFSVFWFGIKKRKFSDLKKIFKK